MTLHLSFFRTISGALASLLFSGFAMTLSAQETDTVPQLRPGERVIFLGDSITQAGAGPGGYVTLVKETLEARKKDLGVEVIGVLSERGYYLIFYLGVPTYRGAGLVDQMGMMSPEMRLFFALIPMPTALMASYLFLRAWRDAIAKGAAT